MFKYKSLVGVNSSIIGLDETNWIAQKGENIKAKKNKNKINKETKSLL